MLTFSTMIVPCVRDYHNLYFSDKETELLRYEINGQIGIKLQVF